jgi:quinoprotein glucose dehydrogenase
MGNAAGNKASGGGWGAKLIALLLGLIGLWMAGGGAWLLSLGGSAYYVMCGIGCLVAAWLYLRGRSLHGLYAYTAVFVATVIWAFAEVGHDHWQLMPRIVGPAVFLVIVIIHQLFVRGSPKAVSWGATAIATIGFALFIGSLTRLGPTSGDSRRLARFWPRPVG